MNTINSNIVSHGTTMTPMYQISKAKNTFMKNTENSNAYDEMYILPTDKKLLICKYGETIYKKAILFSLDISHIYEEYDEYKDSILLEIYKSSSSTLRKFIFWYRSSAIAQYVIENEKDPKIIAEFIKLYQPHDFIRDMHRTTNKDIRLAIISYAAVDHLSEWIDYYIDSGNAFEHAAISKRDIFEFNVKLLNSEHTSDLLIKRNIAINDPAKYAETILLSSACSKSLKDKIRYDLKKNGIIPIEEE